MPLHRAVNAAASDHYYTQNEAAARNTAGYTYEGICAYVYPTIDTPFAPLPIRTLPEQSRLSQDVWYLLVPDSVVGVGNRALAVNGTSVVLAEIDEKNLSRFLWQCIPNDHAAGKIHLQNKALVGKALDSSETAPSVYNFQAGAAGQAWTIIPTDTVDRRQGTDKLQLLNDKAGAGKRLTAGADGLSVAMAATNNGGAQRWRFVAMECTQGYSLPAPPPVFAAQPFTKHLQVADGRIDILGTGTVSDWAMLTARLIYENMLAAVRDQALVERLRGITVLVLGRDDSNAATAAYPMICVTMNEQTMQLYRGSGFVGERTFCIITEEMMCKRGVYNRPGDITTRVFEQTVHELAHLFDFKLGMNGDAMPAPDLPQEWLAWTMEAWFGAVGSPSQRASFKAAHPAKHAYIEPWFDPNNVWSCPPGYVTRY